MVEQWRHGNALGSPGNARGLMDDGGNAAEQCAPGELLEKPANEAGRLVSRSGRSSQPVVKTNLQSYILAENCHKVAEPNSTTLKTSRQTGRAADVPRTVGQARLHTGLSSAGFIPRLISRRTSHSSAH